MWINNVRGRFKCKCWAVTLAIFKMSVRVIVLLFMLPLLHTGEGRTSSTGETDEMFIIFTIY